MKKIAFGLFLIVFVGCQTAKEKPLLMKAYKGEKITLEYDKLPPHEALKISFNVQFLGPWDGSGFSAWSPDRLVCNLDNRTLVDSSFNNCFLVFSDNIWQSFPDPYHEDQINFNNVQRRSDDRAFLYHGGHGASAVASLNFKWNEHSNRCKSVDTTYPFSFIVSHNKTNAVLRFRTIWKEESKNVTTYYIENLKVEPLKKIPSLNLKKEELAWNSFFVSAPDGAQKAWQEVYSAHPEQFMKRISDMQEGDKKRKKYLIAQLSKGRVLTESLYREITFDSNTSDLKEQLHRIACLRELALGRFFTPEEYSESFKVKDGSNEALALHSIASLGSFSNHKKYLPLRKINMRLISYLRMINTDESHRLAIELEK